MFCYARNHYCMLQLSTLEERFNTHLRLIWHFTTYTISFAWGRIQNMLKCDRAVTTVWLKENLNVFTVTLNAE